MTTIMRLAPRLVVYGGALRVAMERDSAGAATAHYEAPAERSPGYPQPVDGDTPPEVVERLRQEALVRQFQRLGVDVTGIREVSAGEMERLVNGG